MSDFMQCYLVLVVIVAGAVRAHANKGADPAPFLIVLAVVFLLLPLLVVGVVLAVLSTPLLSPRRQSSPAPRRVEQVW